MKKTAIFLLFRFSCFVFLFSFVTSCGRDRAAETVTLYTSVDQPYAAPIIKDFEQRTGIKVNLVTDAEATKSVGLAERVRAERNNPQCDVFWSNEPFHTIALAGESLLEPYDRPRRLTCRSSSRTRKRAGTATRCGRA